MNSIQPQDTSQQKVKVFIYRVTAQIKTSTLSVGTLALRVYQTSNSNVTTLIAEENYANISVSVLGNGVNVSPPTRSVTTLVQMAAGERISFGAYSAVALNLLGSNGGVNSFCTIEQVR